MDGQETKMEIELFVRFRGDNRGWEEIKPHVATAPTDEAAAEMAASLLKLMNTKTGQPVIAVLVINSTTKTAREYAAPVRVVSYYWTCRVCSQVHPLSTRRCTCENATVSAGKNTLRAYDTRRFFNDLWQRVAAMHPPYNTTFDLDDGGKVITTVQVISTGVGYSAWSVGGRQFISADCTSRIEEIIGQIDCDLKGIPWQAYPVYFAG